MNHEDTIYMKSDNYFNDPDARQMYESIGNVEPCDVFGGFVPQDKSLNNLTKTQQAIRTRFKLGEDL